MALSETRDVGELYRSEEYKQFAGLLSELFGPQVLGLVKDIELTHPYVGFTHFRDNVLAPHVARRLGEISSMLILNKLIEDGILETYKVDRGGEFQVSAIRKVVAGATDNEGYFDVSNSASNVGQEQLS
jgi:hypothetical protein